MSVSQRAVSESKEGLRVLHFLNSSIPMLSGYTIRSKYIVETEKSLGLCPSVVTAPKFEHESPFVSEIEIEGIRYYRTGGGGAKSVFRRMPYIREYLHISDIVQRGVEIARSEQIAVLHAHSPSLNGLAALKVGRKLGIPVLYEMRALWEEAGVESGKLHKNSLRYIASKFMEERLFAQADGIVVISSHLRDNLISRGVPEGKISIVPNGVDTSKFIPMPAKDAKLVKKFNLDGKIVFGYIGSFFRFEGIPYLVQAFSQIRKTEKNAVLILIGNGEDEKTISTMVREMNLGDSVILPGRVPHDDILRYYSIMDALVYPRIRVKLTEEVTPLKPLEAMSMEKAVIGSDVGGIRELVKDGVTGLLFKADDVGDLVDKCLDLIRNPERRKKLSISARRDMIESRDWSKLASRYTDIYKKLGASRNK